MSVGKPLPSADVRSAAPVTPQADLVTPASEPTVQAREQIQPTGWRDLPTDIIGLVFREFLGKALSTSIAPGLRLEALNAVRQLSKVAKLENLVLHAEVRHEQINLENLEKDIVHAMQKEWRQLAGEMADRRSKLIDDFAATRKTLATAHASGAPLQVDSAHEGIHLCLAEVPLQSLSASFLAALEGKTVKLDATGVGRERFVNEVLTTLAKLPPGCKLVLDARNNDLTADDIDKLTDVMAMKPVIYRLDLGGNPLVDGAHRQQSIERLFRHAGPLTHLSLEGTGIDNAMALALKGSFSQAQCLERLDLRNNLLDAEGAIAMIHSVLPDPDDVTQVARLSSLYAVRLGGNPYLDREEEVRAAVADFERHSNELKDAAYMAALKAGSEENLPTYTDAGRIFEIYGPSENPQVNAFIRMCDSRAEAGRL